MFPELFFLVLILHGLILPDWNSFMKTNRLKVLEIKDFVSLNIFHNFYHKAVKLFITIRNLFNKETSSAKRQQKIKLSSHQINLD